MQPATIPKRPTPLQRLIVAALLAVALVGMQQTALLHWLSHSIEAARHHGRDAGVGAPVAADHCDACLAFSGLGSGAAAAPPWEVPASNDESGAAGAAGIAPRPTPPRLAFRSRAPPLPV